MKALSSFLLIVFLLSSTATGATRAFGVHGIGPRLGVTIDPDQFHFGGHLDLGDLAPKLMILPNMEIGLGDNLTVITTTFELDYRFRQDWGSWNPYLGGGIGPVFTSVRHGRGSETDLGVTLQGGIARRLVSQSGYFFLEMKLGLADSPDIKFTAGWTFGK